MVTKNTKTVTKTNDIMTEKMTELGTLAGKGSGAMIDAIDYFATAIKGGKSNSMPIDANSGVKELAEAVAKYSVSASDAFCDAQNAAAKTIVVAAGTRDTYATYFTTLGMIAVKAPDAIAAIKASSEKFCEGKGKKELAGRNKLQVYYRTACVVRDAIWPKKIDGKTAAARIPSVKEISDKKFVAASLATTKTRAARTPKEKVAQTDTLDTLKAQLLEVAQKLSANDKVPANVRKALLTVSKWS